MKRLLFLIPFVVSYLHALPDTYTSGSIRLIKPSTTTADPTRGAGDKLNGNFDMIAGTFTRIITQITGLSTTTAVPSLLNSTNPWTASQNFSSMTATTGTFFTVNVASLSVTGGTITANTTSMVFPSSGPPTNTDLILHYNSGKVYFGGDAGSGAAAATPVGNSTKTMDITIAGGMYLSTISVFGIPGTTRSPGVSSWTITDIWAECALGSTVGAVGFDLLYSSTQYAGSYSKLFPRVDVSTMSAGGENKATSLFRTTSSFIGAHTFLGVGISTMPQSGTNVQDCHYRFFYWEANKYSP